MRRERISPTEAKRIIELFDSGLIEDEALPQSKAEPIPDQDSDYTWLLILLLIGSAGQGVMGRLLLLQREQARDGLRTVFEEAIKRTQRQPTIKSWHAFLRGDIANYIKRQTFAGSGRPKQADQAALREQDDYLYYFAGERAVRRLTERPMGDAEVTARALLYGGAAWAAWHVANEGESGDGYVCDYIARDDRGTCSSCSEAARRGPYLPGKGPYPGDVCRGRGYCRCTRVLRYDPEAARRLGA